MLRFGIVDFDSSHAIEFTRRFNGVGVDRDQVVEGAQVVLGWPGTSEMAPERIPGFTRQIEAAGVELVSQPDEMLGRIDAVLVLSLSGRPHLERVRPFLEAGVPAFVDKPFACSLDDAREMLRLARAHDTLLFSSSALRFAEEVLQFQRRQQAGAPVEKRGQAPSRTGISAGFSGQPGAGPLFSTGDYGSLHGVLSYGPAKRAEGNPGLFHYGIHATELLFTLMGPGCERICTTYTEGAEVVTGTWADGRTATLRGNRQGATTYGFVAFCDAGVVAQPVSTRYAYRNLGRAIVEAFSSGRPAVPPEITLEIVAFILAAAESERRGGEPVPLDDG